MSYFEALTEWFAFIKKSLNLTFPLRNIQTVFDILKLPKVDGIACPELVDYNVHI